MRKVIVAVVLIGVLHAFAWMSTTHRITPPDVVYSFPSISFSPYRSDQDAERGDTLDQSQIKADLALVAPITRSVRLYRSTQGYQHVPYYAADLGLDVTIGAWLDGNRETDEREIGSAVSLANRFRNVKEVIVGNEAVLRNNLTAGELIQYLRRVRAKVKQPVSTGEVWHVWLRHPELVAEVDFIAVHILPYWEGVPADQTVAYAQTLLQKLKAAYPDKRIVVAEFGWPSGGYNYHAAQPGPIEQARVVRDFIAVAERLGVDYNIIEAFDQPWKINEGSVGPYWGIFDAGRAPKMPLYGEVTLSLWPMPGALAVMLGALCALLGIRRGCGFREAALFAVAAVPFGAAIAAVLVYPAHNYMNVGTWIMWAFGLALTGPLAFVSLVKLREMIEVLAGPAPRRLMTGHPAMAGGDERRAWPKVTIQVPIHRENPDMVAETLQSLAALDYPEFEVQAIVNNTPEEHLWRPIETLCGHLGERFKFVHLPKVSGFKAGALNAAMPQVAPDSQILALIDADYVVAPDWLKALVPAFDDPSVALVQAPQDHRDGAASPLKAMMNEEYAGFFDIGMVQRNEDNAIIAHGTMLLVRRSAFESVGGWSPDTICEDTELGLRLFEAGWKAHYTNRRLGWGMLPDTVQAYRRQRQRWAFGAVQIMRKHLPHFLPGTRTLTGQQKVNFLAGWTYWLSDALGAVATALNLIWVPVVLLLGVVLPPRPMIFLLFLAFAANVLHLAVLYRLRRRASALDIVGAAVAAMSLQVTVAAAVLKGCLQKNLPFLRTEKGGLARRLGVKLEVPASDLVFAAGSILAAVLLLWSNPLGIVEMKLFALALIVQAIPSLCSVALTTVERAQQLAPFRRGRAGTPDSATAGVSTS